MYWWRITKYNPIYRNEHGWYTKNEWTDFSDINKTFSDGTLTIEKYLSIENKYINAIKLFMDELEVKSFTISCFEDHHKKSFSNISTSFKYLYEKRDDDLVSHEDISEYVRLILRNFIWCKLKALPKMEVHFGHDYYMYIGSSKPCAEARFFIESSGLFIESFRSPYIEEYCDADDENNL